MFLQPFPSISLSDVVQCVGIEMIMRPPRSASFPASLSSFIVNGRSTNYLTDFPSNAGFSASTPRSMPSGGGRCDAEQSVRGRKSFCCVKPNQDSADSSNHKGADRELAPPGVTEDDAVSYDWPLYRAHSHSDGVLPCGVCGLRRKL